jgi:hypothetical protein
VLVPLPAFGRAPAGAVVAPVLLVLREPLSRLLLLVLGLLAPGAPMLLRLLFLSKLSPGAAPSLAKLPGVAVLEVLVREVDWHPAANAAASATATMAAGRMDGLSM